MGAASSAVDPTVWEYHVSDMRRWVSFDCYGTLVDWREGMTAALESVAPGVGERLLERYHAHEPALQRADPAPSYRHVLTEGLRLAALDTGVRLAPDDEDVLARTIGRWPVFADTKPVLEQLRAEGWKIGVLSNVDDDLLAGTLPQLGTPVDVVVTAQQVKSYKPALPHFRQFLSMSGASASSWVHVACSWVHDVEPCLRLGVPVAFVNREREVRDTSAASADLQDLGNLPEVLQLLRPAHVADR